MCILHSIIRGNILDSELAPGISKNELKLLILAFFSLFVFCFVILFLKNNLSFDHLSHNPTKWSNTQTSCFECV